MKVLFLSNEHSKSGSAYTHRLAKLRHALEERDIQTGFLSLREQPVGRPILVQPLSVPSIRRKIAQYDFIHAGGNAAYTAAFLKKSIGARLIHDVHGDGLSEAKLKWQAHHDPTSAFWVLQAWVADAIAYRRSDYYLVVSRPLEQRLIDEKHISADKIGLVRNGVDLELFSSPKSKVQSPKSLELDYGTREAGQPFTVCYAGGFQAWQGLDNLVGAVELLPDENVRLKIIGFTEKYAELKATIAGRLGDRVEMVDRVSQPELIAHLAMADALVIPRSPHRAVEVAFPTKFSEYLALGKPVIVCDVDETARLVRENHCGLVSESSDPQALAETVRTASRLAQSELDLMGSNARCLAERELSWPVIGRNYVELLTKWSAR